MSRIQLTYGNSALAWGRDQARSARALASETARVSTVRARGESEITTGTTTAPANARSTAASTPPASTSGNRFARLLADIANASVDLSESEMAAHGVPTEIAAATSQQNGTTQSSVGVHVATDRARFAANASNAMATPRSVAALAQEILATQREGDANERRERIEDRIRRIALTTRREPVHGSPQLSLAYDQIGYVVAPLSQVDRKA